MNKEQELQKVIDGLESDLDKRKAELAELKEDKPVFVLDVHRKFEYHKNSHFPLRLIVGGEDKNGYGIGKISNLIKWLESLLGQEIT